MIHELRVREVRTFDVVGEGQEVCAVSHCYPHEGVVTLYLNNVRLVLPTDEVIPVAFPPGRSTQRAADDPARQCHCCEKGVA